MDVFGTRCRLMVLRLATPGVYLDGGDRGEILLPGKYVPQGTIAGEAFDVFVHRDSEDRLVATPEVPLAVVGEFAALRVVSIHPRVGAFLDWGLSKDLLLPIREQARRVRLGEVVVVFVFVDEHTDRIVATTRLNRHLDKAPPAYGERQRVSLLICGETDLGYNAIINGKHLGLLYRSELTAPLHLGQTTDGYVREVREDGKIDLSLHAAGYGRVAPLKDQILEAMVAAGGSLPFGDKSGPDEIFETFGCSKKAFKQAIGALYRDRLILMGEKQISVAESLPKGP